MSASGIGVSAEPFTREEVERLHMSEPMWGGNPSVDVCRRLLATIALYWKWLGEAEEKESARDAKIARLQSERDVAARSADEHASDWATARTRVAQLEVALRNIALDWHGQGYICQICEADSQQTGDDPPGYDSHVPRHKPTCVLAGGAQ